MRSILVHADSDAASEGRLQVALDCARRFEGHVSLLIATPLREFVSFDPFGGTYFAAEALAKAQADDLALTASVPVLALPQDSKALDFDKPALIAWNGSPEAAHAVRAAVPFLKDRPVVIVTIGGDEGDFAAEEAARYLSRHGIHAELRAIERGVETPEERIEKEADALGAGLIVMGAFGRSRLRETIFGGATQYLVTGGRYPLLLAH